MEREIGKLLAENDGILKTSTVVTAGLSKEAFYKYARTGKLEKAAHGLYLSPTAWGDEMALLQAQIPKAVYSHETALYLHNLAEAEPMPLTVTVPAAYNSRSLAEKGVKVIYIKKVWHGLGLCHLVSPGGHPLVAYDMERTICDIIRKRSKIDVAVFNYALQAYVNRKDKNLNRLAEYAKTLGLEKRIWDVMGVLL